MSAVPGGHPTGTVICVNVGGRAGPTSLLSKKIMRSSQFFVTGNVAVLLEFLCLKFVCWPVYFCDDELKSCEL